MPRESGTKNQVEDDRASLLELLSRRTSVIGVALACKMVPQGLVSLVD